MKLTAAILLALPLCLLFSCSPSQPTAAELNEGEKPDFRISCGISEYGYEVFGHFSPLPDKVLPLDILAGKRRPIDYKVNTFTSYTSLDSLAYKVKVPIFVVENAKGEFWLLAPSLIECSLAYPGTLGLPEIIQTLNPGDSCFAQLGYDYGAIQRVESFWEIGELVKIHYVWQEKAEDSVLVHTITSNWIDLKLHFQMDFG